MKVVLRYIAGGVTAGVMAIAIATTATAADTTVGADAGVAVGNHSIDAGFVHVLQTTLDSQFIGVEAVVVRDRLVLTGFASPGVHSAVLGVVANLLRTPVPVPAAVEVVSPDLGLGLPFLGAGAAIAVPDLGGVLRLLGVVDRIQIIR